MFKPDKIITREEISNILYNYSVYKGFEVSERASLLKYRDYHKISDYAVESMSWANKSGLILGTSKTMLSPKEGSTRAVLATILTRYYQNFITDLEEDKIADDETPQSSYTEVEDSHDNEEDDEIDTPIDNGFRSFVINESEQGEIISENNASYKKGDNVQIEVHAKEGYVFDKWTSSVGGKFQNQYSNVTVFTMPDNNVILTAHYISVEYGVMSDEVKSALGLDKDKVDYDADGLTDSFEYMYLDTDLKNVDSDQNGISDSDEDYDSDGLTNIDEQELGTRPDNDDTDKDGLSDYEEYTTYNTNPLKPDTDNDGLLDGEEIKLGLNPLNSMSNAQILDSEVKIQQTIDDSAKSSSIIESENWLKPKISGKVSGDISKNVFIDEADTEILEDNRSVLSSFLDITTTYDDEVTLSFDVSEPYKGDINNLVIVKFDSDLKTLETNIDELNNTISASINKSGLYFVVDIDEFLKGLGVDVLSNVGNNKKVKSKSLLSTDGNYSYRYDNSGNIIERRSFQKKNNDLIVKPFNSFSSILSKQPLDSGFLNKTTGKADIVFVVDTTGSMADAISGVKNNINKFAEKLVTSYNIDANFALIEYRDIVFDGKNTTIVHKSTNSEWFTNVDIFKKEINTLTVDGGGDWRETPIDGLELARCLSFRENSTKFVILVTDAGYKDENSFGITNLSEMAKLFKKDNIIISAITYDFSEYEALLNTTDGVYGHIYDDFYTTLLKLASKIGDLTNDGEWVLLSDYKAIKLSDKLVNKDKNDTDEDGLKDGEELTNSFEKDLSPYIKIILEKQKIPYEEYEGKSKVTLWNYKSNPVLLDTDYDGIPDGNIDYDGSKVISDLNPRNNNFSGVYHWAESSGKQKKHFTSKELVEFSVDYRLFFKDNKKYSNKLAVISSLYSGNIYKDSYIKVYNGVKGGSDDAKELCNLFGMKDVEAIKIGKNETADVDDKSEIVIGHREVQYKNSKKEIILLVVRGTNGTNAEWTSNFDIGANSKKYFERTGNHDEWLTRSHHKGFDVTSNRIISKVNDYIIRNNLSDEEKSILVTGHSRGAGIANLLGKYFEDDLGYKSYTYTFAAPNTTTDINAFKYRTIFNIVNEDDLIPKLPISHWGFKKYGVTRNISVEDHYENKWGKSHRGDWEWLIGNKRDYNNDGLGGTRRTLYFFKKICDTRGQIYIKDSSSSGIAKYSGIRNLTLKNAEKERVSAEKELKKEKLLRFSELGIEKRRFQTRGDYIDGYYVVVRYCPAYLTQTLANMITGIGPTLGQNVTGKYARAKTSFVLSSGSLPIKKIGGMTDPHLPITYYLIAKNNFKK